MASAPRGWSSHDSEAAAILRRPSIDVTVRIGFELCRTSRSPETVSDSATGFTPSALAVRLFRLRVVGFVRRPVPTQGAGSGRATGGTPGPLNAITDVKGVEVGHTTLISGQGKLVVGKGPVRNGRDCDLAARQRLGRSRLRRLVFAQRQRRNDWHDLDRESGFLDGPVMLTNTHSVGVVRDAVVEWLSTGRDPSIGGLCPSWPKPTTGFSTTLTAFM